MRLCSRCLLEKELTEFRRDRHSKDGYSRRCKTCVDARRAKEDPRVVKNRFLKWRYGITIEQYESLLSSQDERCLICREERKLYVDHDAETKLVRGLLCNTCNMAVGLLRHNPAICVSAASYLAESMVLHRKALAA